MKNLEERALKWLPLSQMEIPTSRTMITLEEDLSPRGETSSVFIVKKWVMLKGSVDCEEENKRKKK